MRYVQRHRIVMHFCIILAISLFGMMTTSPVAAVSVSGAAPMEAPGDALFSWAAGMGGIGKDVAYATTVDSSGNIYTTGQFGATVDFDPGTGTFNLTTSGGDDVFVQKLDSSGNLVWAKNVGGISFDYGYDIAVDNSGNVYITGSFKQTADFDPDAGIHNLTAVGVSRDIFVLKLDSDGEFVWVKGFGGIGGDNGNGIDVDNDGNVYVTGQFQDTVDFDPGPGTTNLTVFDSTDGYILKLDSSGDLAWVKHLRGFNGDVGSDIVADGNGNVYAGGHFEAGIECGGTTSLGSAGSFDAFVYKLDSNGTCLWGKRVGSTGKDTGFGLAVDSAGNVLLTGEFLGTVDFDPGAGTYNLTSSGRDTYVWKLDSSGNFVWVISFDTETDFGSRLAVDASDSVYFAGWFQETKDFDPGSGVYNLTAVGANDAVVVKLASNSDFIWAKGFGGDSNDGANAIALTDEGDVIVAGHFDTISDFDPGAGVYNLTSAGWFDIFVLKLDDISLDETTVCLYESDGSTGISGGQVEYYDAGWQTFGITEANGCVTAEQEPDTYNFRMTYGGKSVTKSQDVSIDPAVVFQTTNVTVQLQDSTGSPLDTGVVKYYAGGWQDFGNTSGGEVSKELLPGSYQFRMSYGSATVNQTQDIDSDPTIVFQTVNVTVQLQDSTGSPLDTGTVKYYAGGWQDFGSTSAGEVSKELLPGSYQFRMSYGSATVNQTQDIDSDPTVIFQTENVTVQLQDSTGSPLDPGVVQYYAGGWQDFGNTSGGEVSKELLPGSYQFRMSYGGAAVDQTQDITANPTVVFQTVNVTVQLQDSTGSPLDTGVVQYYAGGWRDFGSTSGGEVSKELLPGSYQFRMSYGGAVVDLTQNIAANPTVVFQTMNATVQLQNSTSSPLDTGVVQYYAGGWQDFGSTSGGQVSKELLPGSYQFRMSYGGATVNQTQNISSDPTVVFQTENVTVQLQDSTGSPLDTGEVDYYAGGWQDFGNTSGGEVSKELLPGSYQFRMSYGGATVNQTQDIGSDPTVIFQTVNVIVQLQDSTGSPLDTGVVQYYVGGWQDFGNTSGGEVSKELLPGSYQFRMSYGGATVNQTQDIGSDPTVVFQTVNVTVQLQDSTGSPLDIGVVQYYAGGWQDFGSTSGGQVSKELLPMSYQFRMSYGGAAVDLTQDITANPTVVFQTGQVVSGTGTCTHYYAGGWQTFIDGMELLPAIYTFRFNDETPDTDYSVVAGTINSIH